jgi:hypothetical protein
MPQGKGTYGSKMGRPPKKRSMEVVRMPAGKSQTEYDSMGRRKLKPKK